MTMPNGDRLWYTLTNRDTDWVVDEFNPDANTVTNAVNTVRVGTRYTEDADLDIGYRPVTRDTYGTSPAQNLDIMTVEGLQRARELLNTDRVTETLYEYLTGDNPPPRAMFKPKPKKLPTGFVIEREYLHEKMKFVGVVSYETEVVFTDEFTTEESLDQRCTEIINSLTRSNF